ncbi:hypothetical protein BDM02DRAFT_3189206 [Thelephora ganbajun]|uniref:Uncharacterized protein n=1 Tax=Thelephora ganbajun TaxID=370292 RepID=A0ACB6Z8T3_THEGA|nr:hypothetical protein BDM02DRAFT_3189206 [Thelephora ganbajun]
MVLALLCSQAHWNSPEVAETKLESDSGGQSELYLQVILLSLNQSISPNEDPAAPTVWNGPPQEITVTSDPLYASSLMLLLAAFIAMLGKQRLNRYLRHTGGSIVVVGPV